MNLIGLYQSNPERLFQQQKFGNASENWMNFQPGFGTEETFKTTAGTSYSGMDARVDPFKLRQTGLTGN